MRDPSTRLREVAGIGALVLLSGVAFAQAPAAEKPAVQAPAAKAVAAKSTAATKQWRTPWGDPDLQGEWSNATTTALERPAKYNGREFLTKEEKLAEDKETEIGRDKRGAPGTPEDVAGAYNAAWWERGWSDGRTSLIYDPADGKKPPLTADGKRRATLRNESIRTDGPYNGPEDLDLYTRCIVRSGLPRLPTGYDNNFEIVQTPGLIAIVQEQIHETRVIPMDGRAHLDHNVAQWLGDSRGHWEGNTLVVETTNFNERTSFEGATKNMRLTERWTRKTDDTIDYRFTVDDPETWTRPWSAAIVWYKGGTLFEYACHEDNVGLYGILAGARADEKKAAASK
jgi:hypothetical protein